MAHASIDFANTKVAFARLSTAALRDSYWIYKLISQPAVGRLGGLLADIGLKFGLPIRGVIKHTVFKQFCGGETLDECAALIRALGAGRAGAILDYAVEGVGSEIDSSAVFEEFAKSITASKQFPNIRFCVFKLTALAPVELLTKLHAGDRLSADEQYRWLHAVEQVDRLCQLAEQNGVKLMVDAEESWIQGPIDQLAEKMMAKFNRKQVVFHNTVQMYRKDRTAYLHDLHQRAKAGGFKVGVKLVRGAYMEKERRRGGEDPIHPVKAATDQAFDAALAFIVERIEDFGICAGTHNETSTRKLVELMQQAKLANSDSRIEFSQLLGMSDNLTFNLADAGFNVSKYVPYGSVETVIPYLTRRAAENSAISGQTSREVELLRTELERRKLESR